MVETHAPRKHINTHLVLTPSAFFLACLVLVVCFFFVVMEEFKKVVDELQRSVKSLQDQMTSLKSGEVPSGAKTPGERSSPVQQVGDEVPTWAERMELETEALSSSGDEIRPVKVRDRARSSEGLCASEEPGPQGAETPVLGPGHATDHGPKIGQGHGC